MKKLPVLSLALLLAACGQSTPVATTPDTAGTSIRVLSIPSQVALVTLELHGDDAATTAETRTLTATVSGGAATFALPNLSKGGYTLTARGYDNADGQVALYKGKRVLTLDGSAAVDLRMNRLTSALTLNVSGVTPKSNVLVARVGALETRLTVTGSTASGRLPNVPTGRGLNVLVEGRENNVLRQQGTLSVSLSEADLSGNVVLNDVQALAPALPVLTGTSQVKRGEPYTLNVVAGQDTSGGDTLKTLNVQWGDGSADTRALSGTGGALDLSHTYTTAGVQGISVTVTNTAGLAIQASQAVTVNDTADNTVNVDVGADSVPVVLNVAGVDPAADRVVASIEAPAAAINGQALRPQDLQPTSALELVPRGGGRWGAATSLAAGYTYTLRLTSSVGATSTASQATSFVAGNGPVSVTFNDVANQAYAGTSAGAQLTVPIVRLHPTQKAVGYDEIYYKLGRYALDPAKKFDDYCQALGADGVKSSSVTTSSRLNVTSSYACKSAAGTKTADMKTAVVGPGGQLFLTDGHHTYTSFNELADGGPTLNARVIVTDNFSTLSEPDFWARMRDLHKVWLKDERNAPITPAELPGRLGLASMSNDPYRSLVYFTRGIGYNAGTTEFNEFYWGDWLRLQPGFATLDSANLRTLNGYARVVQDASRLMVALNPADEVSSGQTAGGLGKLDAVNDTEFTALQQPLGASKPGKLAYLLDYAIKNGL